MKKKINKKNVLFLMSILFLLVIGCLNTYGASFSSSFFKDLYVKQILWTIISVIAFFILKLININYIYKYSFYFYIFGLLLLVSVLLFGSTINGATSWFKIGNFSFQPSELFKPFYLVYLSGYIQAKDKSVWYYLKLALIIFLPTFLIFIEPDSGVALLYLIMSLGVLLVDEKSKKIIMICLAIIVMLCSMFGILFIYKSDLLFKIMPNSFYYRIDRLLKLDTYQIKNALTGMGSSGVFGHGLINSKVYIPEMVSDFAFALIIMNFGYLMGIFIIIIYTYILYKIYHYRIESEIRSNACILNGILLMTFFQCTEHIFMNLGLTPITGITLPFLSYGGSSLLSYMVLLSIITKITTNNSSYS